MSPSYPMCVGRCVVVFIPSSSCVATVTGKIVDYILD